jgi:hypothetical protein
MTTITGSPTDHHRHLSLMMHECCKMTSLYDKGKINMVPSLDQEKPRVDVHGARGATAFL